MPKSSAKLVEAEPAPLPSRGQKSRDAILLAAARLATLHGLDGLSIGDLAAHLGMSKSGLYAHFKSKEELQLATIETAFAVFEREVLSPAMVAPAGVTRLLKLADEFLSHLRRMVFPGGCFFAAVTAELDTRSGPVHDRVMQTHRQWVELLEGCVRDAQARGELNGAADVSQAAFEVEAMLMAANALFVMSGDVERLAQGRRGIEHALERIGLDSKPTPRKAARAR